MKWTLLVITLALTLMSCGDGTVVGTSTNGGSGGGSGSSSDPNAGDSSEVEIPAENPSLDPEDIDAARLLMQASFGPTSEAIAEVKAAGGRVGWIDQQMSLPLSLTKPYTQANSNGSNPEARHDIWWTNAISGSDQLRQRVAFALSQIFVVSDVDSALANAQYSVSDYYDMLAGHAFGNYRELLEDVTLHPVMGVYLSMVRNEKANPALNIRPDENYAREVMQLFSIGLFELNIRGERIPLGSPTPSYDQDTVESYARVFTGWNYPNSRSWNDSNISTENFEGPMVPVEEFHDTGSKNLLNGVVAPAGLSTREDLSLALDSIFNHPNVGPFISKQLIQRLVTSNPTPEYVERVASVFNNNGSGERGDLGAVIRAILLDDEAINGHSQLTDFGKVREPIIKLTHFFRSLNGVPGPESGGVHATADKAVHRLDELMGQAVMRSRSVFNFYLPDHPLNPQSDLVSPEMQLMSEAWLGTTHINYHHQIYRFHNRADLNDDNPRVTIIDLEPLVDLSSNPNRLLDWYDLIYFAGSMPTELRQTLFNYMRGLGDSDSERFAKVQDSLFILIASAYTGVQR